MRHIGWIVIAVIAIVFLSLLGRLVEVLPASEVMVIQYPGGKLEAFTQPGWYAQWGGTATHYPRRESYEIDNQQIWFNDGGTAKITGNVQFDVPTDPQSLLAMHSKFSNPDTVTAKLIAPAAIKALNASGSLMSSREAYAERRAELQHDIDDQMAHGTWQIRVKEVSETDPVTKETKTLNKGEIVRDSKGAPVRYEESPLEQFGVKTFGLTIATIAYDDAVTKQIKAQQDITMSVQTARANALKAQQDVITAKSQGEASAATAEWKQKTIAAQATTEAQQNFDVATIQAKQRLDVASLDAKAAEQEKAAKILRGQGDAEARRLVLVADNALSIKVDAWKFAQEKWAVAFMQAKNPLVPSVVMGNGSGGNGVTSAQAVMDMIGVKFAKDLALDTNVAAPGK